MNALTAGIYSKLTAGTALTVLLAGTASVYFNTAPDDVALPYVEFSYMSQLEENLTPSRMKNNLVYIRGYTKADSASAGNIATQIDNLFHGGEVTVTGWGNFWCAQESEVEGDEIETNGERIYNAGAVYRIRLG